MKNVILEDNYYLTRSVNNRERYYRIVLNINLFNEYVVSRIFGSCSKSKPTRIIDDYFPTKQKARLLIKKLLKEKLAKGYVDSQ